MHRDVLPAGSATLLTRLAPFASAQPFLLCGGTAVALRLGHRRSDDLDLLTPDPFDVEALAREVHALAHAVVDEERARHTWHGLVDGVRLSFIRQVGIRLSSDADVDGVPLADAATLAALKLNAVSGRGERKDFVDLFALCHDGGMAVKDLMQLAHERMPGMNDAHLLRSLTYFEDAALTPWPEMLWPVTWPQVRTFFADGVRAFLAE